MHGRGLHRASVPYRVVLVGAALLVQACASGRLALPEGPGTTFADYRDAFVEATGACRRIRTLAAELRLSGRAGRMRLHGRVLAGLARPGSLRLEGVAPFGPPAFILVAQPGRSTLMLPRDDRVLVGASAADVLEALAGLALTPDDLRDVLTGCVSAGVAPVGGRAYGSTWIVIRTQDGDDVFLKQVDGARRIVAVRRGALLTEYHEFAGRVPERVRLMAPRARDGVAVDLTVRLSQVRINTTLDPAVFSIEIPTDAMPITLEDLRQSGPLRASTPESPET